MKTIHFVLAGLISTSLPIFAKTSKPTPRADYIAHEWGTFTSVQGSDGVQLEWNPFVVSELPDFVYNAMRPNARARKVALPVLVFPGKDAFVSRQRMETPVIYFYSGEPRAVDVEVTFPEGRFTEWYPQLATAPSLVNGVNRLGRSSIMNWKGIEILPGNGADERRFFPQEESGSHYYAARDTDASGLRVKAEDGTMEHEKFLFYRGVAQFTAPLKVSHWGDHAETIRLHNTGEDPLGPAFVYAVRGNRAALVERSSLAANVMDDVDFKFDRLARPIPEVRAELEQKLHRALVSGGLYDREASAMIKTWDDSWFEEQGTRVLYTLSQKWSDQVLPLKITPAPKELKRVFVGRAELITPAQEWALLKETIRYAESGSLQRREAIAAVSGLNLGRFSDAAGRRLLLGGPQAKEFSTAVWGLLDATRPQKKNPGTTAAANR